MWGYAQGKIMHLMLYESFDNEHKWNTRLFKANLRLTNLYIMSFKCLCFDSTKAKEQLKLSPTMSSIRNL